MRLSAPGDADQLEQLDRPLRGLFLADMAVRLERLGDLPADGQHRVEARQRVLEDHRDLGAADLAQALLRQVEDVLALEGRAVPAVTLPTRLGSRPSSDSALTLLPEPDSPTRPMVSPGAMSYDSPRTARTTRPRP